MSPVANDATLQPRSASISAVRAPKRSPSMPPGTWKIVYESWKPHAVMAPMPVIVRPSAGAMRSCATATSARTRYETAHARPSSDTTRQVEPPWLTRSTRGVGSDTAQA